MEASFCWQPKCSWLPLTFVSRSSVTDRDTARVLGGLLCSLPSSRPSVHPSVRLLDTGLSQPLNAQTGSPLREEAVERKPSKQDGRSGMCRQTDRQTNVRSHLVVLHHTRDLELLDAVTHRDQFGRSPQQTVDRHRADALLQLHHVRLIVPLEQGKEKRVQSQH
ncbi:hypothetical protein EYF80_012905 [Liparis tanakae]|uniref:Uncharacterized protein n=1 Tax=Liparis tanakae TaxID=230148 RepID=A0A4Z2IHQ2_9TELE|nr:hypothetical protein EYF80_012905 [Liparis tanakae]